MNNTIYLLWFLGFDNAPDVVSHCVQSWKHYNPDWKIVLLDASTIPDYVSVDSYPGIEKCHLADIIRMELLYQYGGLWTDATTFCHKPLNDWLPEYTREGFFVFDKPGHMFISNWFIYADKSNYILSQWYHKTMEYYRVHKKAHTYFIHHMLFEELYHSDDTFKREWDRVPKFSATIAHTIQIPDFFKKNGQVDIDSKRVPVYKLSYKCNPPPVDKTMNLYYLYNTLEN